MVSDLFEQIIRVSDRVVSEGIRPVIDIGELGPMAAEVEVIDETGTLGTGVEEEPSRQAVHFGLSFINQKEN